MRSHLPIPERQRSVLPFPLCRRLHRQHHLRYGRVVEEEQPHDGPLLLPRHADEPHAIEHPRRRGLRGDPRSHGLAKGQRLPQGRPTRGGVFDRRWGCNMKLN